MTIAACYLSTEGVVLGADSTATFCGSADQVRHYDYAQKLFEIGQGSTLGFVTWGMGQLGMVSYRTMLAEFSDDLAARPVSSSQEVMERWVGIAWKSYCSNYGSSIQRFRDLERIAPRRPDEEEEYRRLSQLSGGFCIGGRLLTSRTPFAFEWVYGPTDNGPRPYSSIPFGQPHFWGCPNLIDRLNFGVDNDGFSAILRSGKWNGTPQDLLQVLQPQFLKAPGLLPLREAIDWIHSAIFITIKAMKFSQLAQVCGGPIEIATITTDRPFRWVTHKDLDEALDHHRPRRKAIR